MEYFWKKKVILSFLAAILIVAIHNSAGWQYGDAMATDGWISGALAIHDFLAYMLGGVAVPFFFFISGVTMFRNYKPALYKRKMKSRVKSLLIPYLIWNVVGMVVAIIYTYTPLKEVTAGREEFVPTVENVLRGVFLYKYNYHFWFLAELMIYTALAPVINVLITKKWSAAATVVLLLASTLVSGLGVYPLFYVIGCCLGKHYLEAVTRKQSKSVMAMCGVMVLVGLGARVLESLRVIEMPLILAVVSLLILMMGIYGLADGVLPRMKNRKVYGEFFPLYVLHPYIIAVVVKAMFIVGPKQTWMAVVAEVLGTVLAVVLTVIVARVWHKKLPKSYKVCFGG